MFAPFLLGIGLLLSTRHRLPPTSRTVVVYGDSPYGTSPTDNAQPDATPAFIASINADPAVPLEAAGRHPPGKQYCTEDYNRTILGLWSTFTSPLAYMPGDNGVGRPPQE